MTELWYYKQYNNLIAKCQEMEKEGYPEGMYTEVHHILPKCQGGTNDKCNLVRMPARYHIFAHIFLMKAFPNNPKLVFAANCMLTVGNNNTKEERTFGVKTFSSILISQVKEEKNRLMKGENSPNFGLIRSEETRKKISEAQKGEKHHNYGKKASEETRRKMSESRKGEKNSFYGKHHTEESKKKISENRKGIRPTEEVRQKLSECRKGEKNPNYGKTFSEEHKRKLSESHKKPLSEKAYAKLLESRKKLTGANNKNSKKVIGPDGTIYNSVTEAREANGISRKVMFNWLHKHPEKGFRFYTENY